MYTHTHTHTQRVVFLALIHTSSPHSLCDCLMEEKLCEIAAWITTKVQLGAHILPTAPCRLALSTHHPAIFTHPITVHIQGPHTHTHTHTSKHDTMAVRKNKSDAFASSRQWCTNACTSSLSSVHHFYGSHLSPGVTSINITAVEVLH